MVLADLIDRLTIVQLKSIFITDHREKYLQEIEDIKYDITLELQEKGIKISSDFVQAIALTMLTNFCIWMNESKARQGGDEQDKLLKFTHSINGQRNTSKNIISRELGDRIDVKIDCLAEEFLTEKFLKDHGNWNLFEGKK